MALTKAQVREILSAAGVDSEHTSAAVDAIISGHTASIEALREERDTYKKEAEKVPGLEKDYNELKQKTEGKDYDALKKEYDDYKAETEAAKTRGAVEKAYKKILTKAGIDEKYHDRIIKISDLNGLKLDEKGEITTADDVLKTVKTDFSEFAGTVKVSGAKTATPPKTGGGQKKTKKEIMEIEDTTERQEAWEEYLNSETEE